MAKQAGQHFEKLRKDDDDDQFWQTVDLSTLNLLVNAAPADLETVASDGGQKSLLQLGFEDDSSLTGQVNANSLAYARSRSAEMVGKKYDDEGNLVDNPDADWVITDSTRDELRDLISDVMSGDLPASSLPQAIMDSGTFSAARAETIARTELMAANAQGSLAGYRAAASVGVDVKKAWQPDPDACDICVGNQDDGAIDLDDDFSSGDDAPPAHPHCECVLVPVVTDDDGDEE